MEKLQVIIAAAGKGKRLGLGMNKVFAPLAGVPVLVRNLQQLNALPCLGTVFIVLGKEELVFAQKLLNKAQKQFFPLLHWQLIPGGKERQDSVYAALSAIKEAKGWVAVHDGARPFATGELFTRVWHKAKETGAAIAAVPCKDTIKQGTSAGIVAGTLEREKLWAVQTPQIFSLELLRKAYEYLQVTGHNVTDDASAVEAIGGKVSLVMGSYANLKITTPEDLTLSESQVCRAEGGTDSMGETIRVGSGFDVHRLVPERRLILCGVAIPSPLGLLGHSDADVALHALMDAILGAAGLGDIGKLFPDTDMAFKDADSMKLLAQVVAKIQAEGWQMNNADVTIIAQRPKLAPYRETMATNLVKALNLPKNAVNVKATTTEQLGFTGRGEGIASQAVVTLRKTR